MTVPSNTSDPVCPCIHGELPQTDPSAAVFLDRDGVLIEDTGYPSDPDELRLLPGVPEALIALRAAGWALIVVSNQSGIARGKFDLAGLSEIHGRLIAMLEEKGAGIDAIYYCPHHPDGLPPFNHECDHRKPAPGMLLSAARALDLDLGDSWMVGDKESDVEAAHQAGCRAIRLGGGPTVANTRATDLLQAANFILTRTQV